MAFCLSGVSGHDGIGPHGGDFANSDRWDGLRGGDARAEGLVLKGLFGPTSGFRRI